MYHLSYKIFSTRLLVPLPHMSTVFVKDSLGSALEEICKIVPAGCLVFFPSYKLMDKLCTRWRTTGQWARLNAKKSLFVGKMLIPFSCALVIFLNYTVFYC